MASPPSSPASSASTDTWATNSAVGHMSICQLARRYNRIRLLVSPIEWTDVYHLKLLGFRFQDPVHCPLPDTEPCETNDKMMLSYIGKLCTYDSSAWRHSSIQYILARTNGPFQALVNLHFYFHRHHVEALPCVAFFPGKDQSMAQVGRVPALFAYIDASMITSTRSELVSGRHPYKPRGFGPKLHRNLNPYHDPYIVAVLIAVAQSQQHALKEQKQHQPETYQAHVLFTMMFDDVHLHHFSADIPWILLAKLNHPAATSRSQGSPFIPIRHRTILFQPHNTFRDRVLSVLHLPEYTKRFNEDPGETNTGISLQTFPTKKPLQKRKHRRF